MLFNESLIKKLIDTYSSNQDEDIINELASYGPNVIPYFISIYNEAGASGKCGILQTLLKINHIKAKQFLEAIINGNDIFFIKAFAEEAFKKLETQEQTLRRKVKNLETKKDEDELCTEITSIGILGDSEVIPYLENLKFKSLRVKEYVKVAGILISQGLDVVIKEYRANPPEISRDPLADTIYCMKYNNLAVNVIMEDLFSIEEWRVRNGAGGIDADFPREKISREIIERLFEIITGDFDYMTRSFAINGLKVALTASDKQYIKILEEILDRKIYKYEWKLWKWPNEADLSENIKETLKIIKRKK